MKKNVEIEVLERRPGRSLSKGLRRDKRVPAVVYGPSIKNMEFSLLEKDAAKYSASAFENEIFVFKSENSDLNSLKVLKRKTDVHPVSRRPMHIDFYAIDMKQKVKVDVKLDYQNTELSIGVKEEGGLFNALLWTVEVECLPTEIPESFSIDVAPLKLNESLHVSDIIIPEGVKLITHKEDAIASITKVKEEEIVTTAAPVAGEGTDAKGAEKSDDKKGETKS